MSDRDTIIKDFLAQAGWGNAVIAPLAGDASNRRYLRLTQETTPTCAVVMDAPADKGEDVHPFVQIATYLSKIGLSAPQVIAADFEQGLLLLEDLGDDLFARVLTTQPELEKPLYFCATDALIELHEQTPPKTLDTYSVSIMTELAALAYRWYLGASRGQDDASQARFCSAMSGALSRHAPQHDVLIQRDYHSENLIWLPDRDGAARVGLLDFQDAMLGHRAYDLVSLLQDARRDVPPDIEKAMLDHYIAATHQQSDAFAAAYHVLGAQRNLRILGVFARLCVRDGKENYVDLIPRVWGLLQRDLSHPALTEVKQIVIKTLPAPDDSLLQSLKAKCATLPAL